MRHVVRENAMGYVESYILPVKAADLAAYAEIAAQSAAIWRRLGALTVMEATADKVPHGEVTSFPRSVLAEPDEVVVIANLTFRDREHRDAVMAAMFADAEMLALMERAPVDGRRMIWGGFDIIVNEGS